MQLRDSSAITVQPTWDGPKMAKAKELEAKGRAKAKMAKVQLPRAKAREGPEAVVEDSELARGILICRSS